MVQHIFNLPIVAEKCTPTSAIKTMIGRARQRFNPMAGVSLLDSLSKALYNETYGSHNTAVGFKRSLTIPDTTSE